MIAMIFNDGNDGVLVVWLLNCDENDWNDGL